MTWPTEQAHRAAMDACEHEGLHKACATCAPIIAATVSALAPHVAALVRAERAAALREAAEALDEMPSRRGPAVYADERMHADGQDVGIEVAADMLRARADAEEAGR